jgi:hypothetical protein
MIAAATRGQIMNGKGVFLAIVTLAVFCTLQAGADTPNATPDVRCMIVGMRMGQVPGATAQTAGIMAIFYYLGRLDALSPKPDLEALIESEVVKMSPDDLKSEAVRCGSEITEKGKQLQVIGQHLIERGKKLQLEEQQKKQ